MTRWKRSGLSREVYRLLRRSINTGRLQAQTREKSVNEADGREARGRKYTWYRGKRYVAVRYVCSITGNRCSTPIQLHRPINRHGEAPMDGSQRSLPDEISNRARRKRTIILLRYTCSVDVWNSVREERVNRRLLQISPIDNGYLARFLRFYVSTGIFKSSRRGRYMDVVRI